MKYIVMLLWVIIVGLLSNTIKEHSVIYVIGYSGGTIGTMIMVCWDKIFKKQ